MKTILELAYFINNSVWSDYKINVCIINTLSHSFWVTFMDRFYYGDDDLRKREDISKCIHSIKP